MTGGAELPLRITDHSIQLFATGPFLRKQWSDCFMYTHNSAIPTAVQLRTDQAEKQQRTMYSGAFNISCTFYSYPERSTFTLFCSTRCTKLTCVRYRYSLKIGHVRAQQDNGVFWRGRRVLAHRHESFGLELGAIQQHQLLARSDVGQFRDLLLKRDQSVKKKRSDSSVFFPVRARAKTISNRRQRKLLLPSPHQTDYDEVLINYQRGKAWYYHVTPVSV